MCVPADIVGKLTPLGNGVIEVDRDSGHVTMTMKPRAGLTLRHNINVMDDGTVDRIRSQSIRNREPTE